MGSTLSPLVIAKGKADISLLPKMANRHGLIAGATGTGKTVSLRVLAEQFSKSGVPVFMSDVKGDLSGLPLPGGENPKVVERVWQDLESNRRGHLRQIEWLMPGVVWAMDGTEYGVSLTGKIYLCNKQDLGSRYKFLPMAGGYPVGEEIAGYLSEKFDRYGAPLVLKRDNEGNMNHRVINDLLSESFVLPLNSPEYYAPYNGAIEESQREVKRCLRDKLALDLPTPGNHITAYAEAAVNDLNHRHRPCLNGRTSYEAFFVSADRPAFTKRERRGIYDWVMERVERILLTMNQRGQAIRESAWRIAVESRLKSRGFIKVHINQKCHPILPPFLSHE